MRRLYTLFALVTITAVLGSCSSSRNAQNADDIYYSPGGKATTSSKGGGSSSDYYSTAPSDNYVRMKVQDPSRWSYFDDYNGYDSYYAPSSVGFSAAYGYGYPSYGFGYGMGFGPSFGFGFWDPYMCWNNYFMWNSFYNPYFYNPYYGGGVMVVGHQIAGPGLYTHLRTFNSTAYQNGLRGRTVNNSPSSRIYRPGMTATNSYNRGLTNNNSGTNRMINNNGFNRSNNNNNNGFRPATFSQPTRSFSPAGGGGGGGGFRPMGRH